MRPSCFPSYIKICSSFLSRVRLPNNTVFWNFYFYFYKTYYCYPTLCLILTYILFYFTMQLYVIWLGYQFINKKNIAINLLNYSLKKNSTSMKLINFTKLIIHKNIHLTKYLFTKYYLPFLLFFTDFSENTKCFLV